MKIIFDITNPGELSAGIYGYTDIVKMIIESGNPGGEKEEFVEHIKNALSEWYEGSNIVATIDNENLTNSKIKSCPFCGGDAEYKYPFKEIGQNKPLTGIVYIECKSCGVKTRQFRDEKNHKSSMDNWNNRII